MSDTISPNIQGTKFGRKMLENESCIKDDDSDLFMIYEIDESHFSIVFNMALMYLMKVGVQTLKDENIVDYLNELRVKSEKEIKNRKNDSKRMEISNFEHEVLECAIELARFSPWDLIRYIKIFVNI